MLLGFQYCVSVEGRGRWGKMSVVEDAGLWNMGVWRELMGWDEVVMTLLCERSRLFGFANSVCLLLPYTL